MEFYFSFPSAAYLLKRSANERKDKIKWNGMEFYFSFPSAAYLLKRSAAYLPLDRKEWVKII
jgi:hypothetical protein